MKPRGMAIVAGIAGCVAVFSGNPAPADNGKDPDLRARLVQLEMRVAELEKEVKALRASAPKAPRTELENRLIGTWVVADPDKKHATFTDMRLHGDGSCDLVGNGERGGSASEPKRYKVIGQQMVIEPPAGRSGQIWELRLVSVTEKELVTAEGTTKVRYTRSK